MGRERACESGVTVSEGRARDPSFVERRGAVRMNFFGSGFSKERVRGRKEKGVLGGF